jgi:hypothetical protein
VVAVAVGVVLAAATLEWAFAAAVVLAVAAAAVGRLEELVNMAVICLCIKKRTLVLSQQYSSAVMFSFRTNRIQLTIVKERRRSYNTHRYMAGQNTKNTNPET